jgi:hypothetical protein
MSMGVYCATCARQISSAAENGGGFHVPKYIRAKDLLEGDIFTWVPHPVGNLTWEAIERDDEELSLSCCKVSKEVEEGEDNGYPIVYVTVEFVYTHKCNPPRKSKSNPLRFASNVPVLLLNRDCLTFPNTLEQKMF